MKIGELFAEIGFKTDTSGLQEATGELKGFQTKTLGAIAGVTAFIAAMANLQGIVRGASAELKAFSNQTGLSVEKLQLLQNEAKSLDINADPTAIENSIRAIQNNLGDIAIGRGDTSIFQLLGIDPRNKDAFDVIDEFQSKIPQLKAQFGQNQVVNFGQQLGLDASLVTALQQSTKESRAFAQSLVRTAKNTDTLNNLSREIGDMNAGFGLLKDMLVEAIAPAISLLVKAIKTILTPLINILSVFNEMDPVVGAVATSLTLAFGAGAVASLLGFTTGLRKVMMALTSIKLLAGGLTVVFKRLLMVMLKFILPFLILEDLFVFFQGGKSLFGDMLEGLQNADFSALFDSLKQGFLDIFREIGRFLVEDVFDPIFEKVGINLVTTNKEKLEELGEDIADVQEELAKERAGKAGIFGLSNINGLDIEAIKELELRLAELNQQRMNLEKVKPMSMSPAVTNNARNNTIQVQNDIQVNGANMATTQQLSDTLNRQLRQTANQINNNGTR